MKKIVCDSYEDVCRFAADIFTKQVKDKPDSILGLATGSTPIDLYNELVQRANNEALDFSKVRTYKFNLFHTN